MRILRIKFLTLLITGALITGLTSQFSVPAAVAADLITLKIGEDQIGGYSRNLFRHWIDADKNGCNTRYEVLIAEAIVKPSIGSGCYLTGGKWRSPFDRKIYTSPVGLDIDHLVPLAEAWRSGAWSWSPTKRMEFANDLGISHSLVAVTAALNRSKGDKDVSLWLPPRAQCSYISSWIAVKARFDLTVDAKEAAVLNSKIIKCKIINVVIK